MLNVQFFVDTNLYNLYRTGKTLIKKNWHASASLFIYICSVHINIYVDIHDNMLHSYHILVQTSLKHKRATGVNNKRKREGMVGERERWGGGGGGGEGGRKETQRETRQKKRRWEKENTNKHTQTHNNIKTMHQHKKAHTDQHKQTSIHTNTNKHTHQYKQTSTHTHTPTQTNKYTHTNTNKQANTTTQTNKHTNTNEEAHTDTRGAGIAQWLEHRTRDWKVAGSNPCWNGGRIFFSRVDFLCWLLFRYPFHPRVTTVARKKSRSFCQKCRWQVTAKHAYTLRMWILLNRASALVTTCP